MRNMNKTERYIKVIKIATAAVFGAAAAVVFFADKFAPSREWAALNTAEFNINSLSKPVISAETPQININTATVEEISTIPQIGEFAGEIAAYRERFGMFKEISEIIKINGIDEKMLEQIKGLITV